MKRIKRKPEAAPPSASTPVPLVQPPADAPPAMAIVLAPHEPWYRSILTDRNEEFDTGRVLVAIVILATCWMQWYDVSVNANPFNAQTFGIGIGAVLGGFAAYLYGDAQRPPPIGPTTTTSIQKVQTTTP